MNKKQFVEQKVKELMLEGKSLKESLSISFTQWDKENNLSKINNWLEFEPSTISDIEMFINAIGKVKFRQFSNSEDMLNFAKIYYDDFCKTFRKQLGNNSWNYFSDRLKEHWLVNLYSR